MSFTRTRHDRHVNGKLAHKKEFQAAIINLIRDGNCWPAEVAQAMGWDGSQKERTVINNDMAQLVRLGFIDPPTGYTVTKEGIEFAKKYGPQTPPDAVAAHASVVKQVVPVPVSPKLPTPELAPVSCAPSPVRPLPPTPLTPAPPASAQPVLRRRRF
jgi:hypothetical protein